MVYDIDAVFVTYRPDFSVFEQALNSIKNQVRTIYIVDNSASADVARQLRALEAGVPNARLLLLERNVGIAKAQNLGMARAMEEGAHLSLLSDQDTIYPPDYVANMLANYRSLDGDARLAAIAPDFQEANKASGEGEGFFELQGVNSVKVESTQSLVDVAQVIASGMIINHAALARVGMMDEALFIDWVDFEWCWRARAHGYRIVGCRNVVIRHTLGDGAVKVGAKTYSLHSPQRNYYIVRNGIAIAMRKKYLGTGVRVGIFLKSLRYMVAFSMFGDQHLKNIVYCSKGLVHGVVGRLGPLER